MTELEEFLLLIELTQVEFWLMSIASMDLKDFQIPGILGDQDI